MAKNIEKYLNAEKVDISEWEKIASAALKGESLDNLNKEIDNDILIKPLYTSSDEEDDYSLSLRRGLKTKINEYMPWYICTTVDHHKDTKILNGRILGELERGSNSVELSYFETNTLSKVLNNVDLTIAPLFIRNINYSKENLFRASLISLFSILYLYRDCKIFYRYFNKCNFFIAIFNFNLFQ